MQRQTECWFSVTSLSFWCNQPFHCDAWAFLFYEITPFSSRFKPDNWRFSVAYCRKSPNGCSKTIEVNILLNIFLNMVTPIKDLYFSNILPSLKMLRIYSWRDDYPQWWNIQNLISFQCKEITANKKNAFGSFHEAEYFIPYGILRVHMASGIREVYLSKYSINCSP